MIEIIFLVALAAVWIAFASAQDLKTREVSNWISFSLIIFALGFRFFYSLFESNPRFFYQGLIGLGIFFVLGNALYYGRMFAGGDAKLMISLGAVLGFSDSFFSNLENFALFFLIFLFSGAAYGFAWSVALSARDFKEFRNEFKKQFVKNKIITYSFLISGLLLLVLGFFDSVFFYFGILFFVFPYFYIYAKTVDEACLVKKISAKKITEGDWLYEDVKAGKETIKANWNGLSREEIRKIQKKLKEVKIRQGIPFVPVFLISFLVFVLLWFLGFSLIGVLG
ncbi:MAG: prepilin peptidase [archaeon]